VQLIQGKNATPTPTSPTSPTAPTPAAMSPGEELQMTWTDETEKVNNPAVANPESIKDLFNMKP
ncbi:hypothetical protein M9458_018255, partial [Cirrhinus mrigala]